MARLDDLVARINDQKLRREIEAALADMKRRQRFGLVFEEHIPETTALFGLPVQTGTVVQRRDDPAAKTLYRVIETTPQGQATVEPTGGGKAETVPVSELCLCCSNAASSSSTWLPPFLMISERCIARERPES